MNLGIVTVSKNEFREGTHAVRELKIFILGIPFYSSKFLTTNNDAVRKLTETKETELKVCGFTNNQKQYKNEAKSFNQKGKSEFRFTKGNSQRRVHRFESFRNNEIQGSTVSNP